jgi:hypothetical protein
MSGLSHEIFQSLFPPQQQTCILVIFLIFQKLLVGGIFGLVTRTSNQFELVNLPALSITTNLNTYHLIGIFYADVETVDSTNLVFQ